MADYLELLNAAVRKQQDVAATGEMKKASVAAATETMPSVQDFYNIAAGTGNQAGAASMTEMEADLRSMNPSELYGKYGAQATQLLEGRARGSRAYLNDQLTPSRGASEIIQDTALGVGTGLANSLAGIGALGAGLVDAEAGAAVAESIQGANEWAQGLETSQMESARRVQEARSGLNQRDNAAQFEVDREVDGDFMASLKRIGRDTLDTLDTSTEQSILLGQGVAEGVGSLLAGGPIAGGLRAGGRTALTGLSKVGVGAQATERLANVGGKLAMPAAIAAMESGGAYQQTVADVMGMQEGVLWNNSERFNELLDQGVLPDEARAIVANEAGLQAAAIQAPIAAATGALVSRFEASPFSVPSVRAGLTNALLREPIEEGIQSGSAGLAQNTAVQQIADRSRAISEGVGEQVAEGALFGMGTGAVVQGPAVVGALGEQVVNQAGRVIDAQLDAAEKASRADEEAAETAVMNAADQAAATVEEAKTSVIEGLREVPGFAEQEARVNQYVSSVMDSLPFDQEMLTSEGMPDSVREVLTGSKHRIDSLDRLATALEGLDENDPRALELGFALYVQMDPLLDLKDKDNSVLDLLPEDHMARDVMGEYSRLLTTAAESPKLVRALDEVRTRIGRLAESNSVPPVTDESVATPEGQTAAQQTIAIATVTPHKGNLQAVESVLMQAQKGNLTLTAPQRSALLGSVALLQAAQAYDQEAEARGLTKQDIVAKEIKTDLGNKGTKALSAWQHSEGVVTAMRGGDATLAAERLVDFGRFVQHMQNKVGALNSHFATGNPKSPAVKYQALMPDAGRSWQESKEGMKVHPGNVGSVKFAQTVALEAKTLADIFNQLSQAFPELNAGSIAPVQLSGELQGQAEEVVARMKNPAARPVPAPSAPLVPEAPAAVVEEVEPEIPDAVHALSDEELNNRLNRLSFEDPQYAVLDAEMSRREDEAVAQMQEEEEVPDPVDDSSLPWDDGSPEETAESQVEEESTSSSVVATAILPADKWHLTEDIPAIKEFTENRDATGLLNYLSESGPTKAYRAIAQRVALAAAPLIAEGRLTLNRPIMLRNAGHTYGSMRDRTTEVAMRESGYNFEVALHEMLHGVTMLAIHDGSTQLSQQLDRIHNEVLLAADRVRKQPIPEGMTEQEEQMYRSIFNMGGAKSNALANTRELVSWGLSNAVFQNFLNTVPMPGTKQTAWGAFVQTIRQFLGLAPSADNALSALLQAVDDYLPPIQEAAKPVSVQKSEEKAQPAPAVEAAPQTESAEPAQGMDSVFPALLGSTKGVVKNWFKKAFRLPQEARSRLLGSESPLSLVGNALSSGPKLRALLGDKLRHAFDDELASAYQQYLKTLPVLRESMEANLQAFLTEKDRAGMLRRGQPVNRFVQGRALNIVDEIDGEYAYNQELVEGALLAGLQWVLSADKYGSRMEDEDVAKWVGTDLANLSIEEVETLKNGGLGTTEAVRTLARMIRSFWGVSAVQSMPKGYTEGIPEAVAGEVLRALVEGGLVTTSQLVFSQQHGLDREKTIDLYQPVSVPTNSPLHSFPEAIEQVAVVDPEGTSYIGDVDVPVAQRQMNNPLVANTKEQKAALANEQKTSFYANIPMIGMLAALGERNLIELFGGGSTENRPFNVNHAKSVDGKNRAVVAGFQTLVNTLGEMRNVGEQVGTELAATPIRYAYNFSRVGRMQMLGKHSPQANKLVREALLPTWSTLDLSKENGAHYRAFSLALGQALGIKVHAKPVEQTMQEVKNLLNGALGNSLSLVQDWIGAADLSNPLEPMQSLGERAVATLKEDFASIGEPVTPVALHALMEYARYSAATPEQRQAFRTALYLEADGVTNGPVNAMALMTIGRFTPSQLRNIAKGGLFLGGRKSMNQHRGQDSVDLYQASTQAFSEHLANFRKQYSNNPPIKMQMDDLFSLMDLFFGKDLSFDEESGSLTLGRGIAKNPLTITIYGSGVSGIANKLTKQLVETIYERMSETLQRQAENSELFLQDALFPGDAEAGDKANRMMQALESLIGLVPVMGKKGLFMADSQVSTVLPNSFQDFTISGEQFQALQRNMRTFFVDPLRQGINDTVGEGVMRAVDVLRKATQVQSIFLEHEFKRRVQQALNQRKKHDPNWRRGDFLSEQELGEIMKQLRPLSPLVSMPGQRFFIAGSDAGDINTTSFGRALDGRFRATPSVYGPRDSGVSGIPYLTIGSGDGKMMQLLSLDESMTGTLKIFDGMNMPLDKITEYGEQANKAVWESWQGNPLQAVATSWEQFSKVATMKYITDDMRQALVRALFEPEFWEGFKDIPAEAIQERMDAVGKNIDWAARSAEARHQVLRSMAVSVDQMAAADAPYVRNGHRFPDDAGEEQIIAELNERYAAAFLGEAEAVKQQQKKEAALFRSVGRTHKSGVQELSFTALKKLTSMAELSAGQQVVLGEALRAESVRDYKIVVGDRAQIQTYQQQVGLPQLTEQQWSQGEVQGYTSVDTKTIYLINPSQETLVHEVVHAATFGIVLAHYQNDPSLGSETKGAVQRIEGLMDEFLNGDWTGLSAVEEQARNDAIAQITAEQTNLSADPAVSKAKALNEFMAWALANTALASRLQQKAAPKLVQLAKNAVQFLKKLIWGRKQMPKVAEDMLSNLQFNTAILMRQQPSLGQIGADVALFQQSGFGTSSRLSSIRGAFQHKIGAYLSSASPIDRPLRKAAADVALTKAIDLADSMIAHGFAMNKQEVSTFHMITQALATETRINPSSLVRAQELFAHVLKALTVEHFLADPTTTDPALLAEAKDKYDSVVGKNRVSTDAAGRSSLLPVFLGLATVNEEFRDVLRKIDPPKAMQKTGAGLDTLLENLGNSAMDRLSQRLSGERRSASVQEAVDALLEGIRREAQDDELFIDQFANAVGSLTDRANQIIVDGMTRLSDAAIDGANRVLASSANGVVKKAANLTKLVASLATEENGERVAEGIMENLNKTKLWNPVFDLINDLVGRTGSNAGVYDLIKSTRSHVQQARQQFRDSVPAIIAGKFSRALGNEEWSSLYRSMGKTDLVSLRGHMTNDEILSVVTDTGARRKAIKTLENSLRPAAPGSWPLLQRKMQQLAHFMNTGEAGNNLLRNAHAVAHLFGERSAKGRPIPDAQFISGVDQLVTLYALDNLNQGDQQVFASLVQDEKAGLDFVLSYLNGQHREEQRKSSSGRALVNHYKGYLPGEFTPGISLQVAEDVQSASLVQRSHAKVADYAGSSVDHFGGNRGYYFAPVQGRALFNQGIMQNVRQTASGVDASTGFTYGMPTAGVITGRLAVQNIARQLHREKPTREPLLPVYDETGEVVAFERSVDPQQLQRLKANTHLGQMIGVWRGRQVEEVYSQGFNTKLVDALHAMYRKDMQRFGGSKDQYVDLLDSKTLASDPILADAVGLFSPETLEYIDGVFGKEFWVRRDMLTDVVGHRMASVGDFWSGNTRWTPGAQNQVKRLAMSVWGNDAYRLLVNGEKVVQNFVGDARTLIVVKSVVVPFGNFIANVFQLMARGVPLTNVARELPKKTAEIHAYVRSRIRQIEVEAELRAAEGHPIRERKLQVELQSILDGHKRLSIWPLIEAGEFSSISDVGVTHEELALTSGKLASYIEQQVDKLPAGVRTAGRYALITQDTALFQGLQRAVQYGDFLAKAVLFDELTQRKGLTEQQAMARITEEFVNYDRLAGRFRNYLESIGLLWFYNFKIRASKVALSMLRNNPLHALLASTNPVAALVGSNGLPVDDSLLVKLMDGSLGASMGPGQGISAPLMNPVANLLY